MAKATSDQRPDVLHVLQAAAKGLRWPSETDKPVKAVQWKVEGVEDGAMNEAALRAAAKIAPTAAVKGVTVDELFAPVVTVQDWFGDEEKAMAQRFAALKEALVQHLASVTAFRVEGAHSDHSVVDVYVLGRTPGQAVAGISTQLVET